MPFTCKGLEIPGLLLIEPKLFSDSRGFFMETYQQKDFDEAGIPDAFVQENHAMSHRGVLRGLHFQAEPFAQGKLVRCVRGRVFDVAVDIRKGSSTFGKWVSLTLSEKNRWILWIPKGFAHGYQALEDQTEILYKTDNYYSPAHERGIVCDDPDLAIPWPLENPLVSEKDRKLPRFKELAG